MTTTTQEAKIIRLNRYPIFSNEVLLDSQTIKKFKKSADPYIHTSLGEQYTPIFCFVSQCVEQLTNPNKKVDPSYVAPPPTRVIFDGVELSLVPTTVNQEVNLNQLLKSVDLFNSYAEIQEIIIAYVTMSLYDTHILDERFPEWETIDWIKVALRLTNLTNCHLWMSIIYNNLEYISSRLFDHMFQGCDIISNGQYNYNWFFNINEAYHPKHDHRCLIDPEHWSLMRQRTISRYGPASADRSIPYARLSFTDDEIIQYLSNSRRYRAKNTFLAQSLHQSEQKATDEESSIRKWTRSWMFEPKLVETIMSFVPDIEDSNWDLQIDRLGYPVRPADFFTEVGQELSGLPIVQGPSLDPPTGRAGLALEYITVEDYFDNPISRFKTSIYVCPRSNGDFELLDDQGRPTYEGTSTVITDIYGPYSAISSFIIYAEKRRLFSGDHGENRYDSLRLYPSLADLLTARDIKVNGAGRVTYSCDSCINHDGIRDRHDPRNHFPIVRFDSL